MLTLFMKSTEDEPITNLKLSELAYKGINKNKQHIYRFLFLN
jgi:hypothetical protein